MDKRARTGMSFQVLQYISEHFTEPLTLETTARALGISRIHLSHIFSQQLKINFRQYINTLRIDRACALLRDPSYTISQIVYLCGYGNPRTFHRAFLSIHNMTPKEYRARFFKSSVNPPDVIDEDEDSYVTVHGSGTRFIVNENPEDPSGEEAKERTVYDDDEPIPLSSKAEMHREQRRIIREKKLEEKKRLREEARQKRAEERRLAKEAALAAAEIPEDDSDLEEEARLAKLLDDQLSEDDEDILDDLGLDMNEIIGTMAKQAKALENVNTDQE